MLTGWDRHFYLNEGADFYLFLSLPCSNVYIVQVGLPTWKDGLVPMEIAPFDTYLETRY